MNDWKKGYSMCGRFIQISNPEKIRVKVSELEIDKNIPAAYTPRYNIAPTQKILTVLNYQKPAMTYTRWGLIPFWAKDMAIGARMINARAETLLEKYLLGRRINIDKLDFGQIECPHTEINILKGLE